MIECAREAEVLDAVTFRRWPHYCDEGLRTHVAACAMCTDLVDVVRALHDDRESACRDARVPAAGQVWWRATIRARADAAHTAAEPITVVQGIAGACAVGLACGLAAEVWRSLQGALRFEELVSRLGAGGVDLIAASSLALQLGVPLGRPLLLTLAACLVLAPLALYVALADE
jgi:hypothetical protein